MMDARNSPNRLLIADSDADTRRIGGDFAAAHGYTIAYAADEAQFRDLVGRFAPTVILIDPLGLAPQDFDALRWLGLRRGRSTLIVATAQDPCPLAPEEIHMAYGLEVAMAVAKPLNRSMLEAVLLPQLVRSRQLCETDLRRAVDRAQLCAHYQPKLRRSAQGWELAGIEALLRWNHPEHGLVYPDDFIELAEAHGLIGALTDYVLQDGIDQIAAWNQRGHRLGLSVNLSAKLLTDVDFADRMCDFLFSRGVAPDQLTLEITESAAFGDPASTLEILSRLRARGIGLALDDFGIGYSSLTQLYKLPFSEVKIDRTIGMEIAQTPAARMIVRAIVDLGHHLGLTVCCEGVESKTSLDVLHQCGCDQVQGYFIARPMASEDLGQWIPGRHEEGAAAQAAVG